MQQTEHYIREIATIYGQIKKKYKLLKYIDDSYLNMLKQNGYSEKFTTRLTAPHELRDALCNAIFRNIVLEIYSIFFDERSDVLSSYVMKAIYSEKPDFLEKYDRKKSLLSKYRHKILAHKAITKRAENYGYKHIQLDELMELSEQIFEWFISHSLKNFEISKENYVYIKYYEKETIDYKNDETIDFFMKRIAGLPTTEITDIIWEKHKKNVGI